MSTISRVWIEDGCIGCGACPTVCPEVFTLPEDLAFIRAAVRMDGVTSSNHREMSRLNAHGTSESERIEEAAHACPLAVITWD